MIGPGLQRTLRQAVDPKYGIAAQLVELDADPLTPDVFVAYADGGAPSYFVDNRPAAWANDALGSGAVFTREGALWSTLGEVLERYCASVYDVGSLREMSGRALGEAAIRMQDMILYSSLQYETDGFAFSPYEPDRVGLWGQGENLVTGAVAYAPAQLLYLSHEWVDEMLLEPTSTGLACHSDPELARRSALLEVIERDGFASAWLMGMALPKLELSDAERARLCVRTCRALDNPELTVSLRAIPNRFGVANVLAVAEHRRWGYGTVGGAADLCPYRAIEKAVVEALHSWLGFSRQRKMRAELPEWAAVTTPHDHALSYLDKTRWRALDGFLQGGERVGLDGLGLSPDIRTSGDLVARLNAEGYSSYLFDLTTDDVAALSLKTVRAIIPGLQSLSFGQAPASEDRRRLEHLATCWNMVVPERLTLQPHPFP